MGRAKPESRRRRQPFDAAIGLVDAAIALQWHQAARKTTAPEMIRNAGFMG
jgi:hypothetical protein